MFSAGTGTGPHAVMRL